MQFLNNKRLCDKPEKNINTDDLQKMKEPNTLVQVLVLIACAFASLMIVYYTKKYAFGLHTRSKFNFIDFRGDQFSFIIAFITIILARPIIKTLFFPLKTLDENTVFGYHIKSISLYSVYDGFMSKTRKVISLLSPYIIISLITLILMKLKYTANLNISLNSLLFFLYINALLSCSDLYNAIFIIACPKNSMIYDDGKSIYYTDKENI